MGELEEIKVFLGMIDVVVDMFYKVWCVGIDFVICGVDYLCFVVFV